MDNILEVKDLTKKYDAFELKKVNFTVPKGMIVGFIGENGAGKTTTIKSILNLISMDSGSIKIFNSDIAKNKIKIKEEIGVVLDDSFLSDELTPQDIHKIMKYIYKNWDKNLYFESLERFQLPKDKMIKTFSSGMKMKLKIVTALSHHPKFLILDEPTSGLDPVARREILDLLQDFIQDEKHSILVSSHITSDLEHIADYVVFIHEGEILFQKNTDELLESYGIVKCGEEEFHTINKDDYLAYTKKKFSYEILVENKKAFQKKYDISIIDKPSLEDIMLFYIKGGK